MAALCCRKQAAVMLRKEHLASTCHSAQPVSARVEAYCVDLRTDRGCACGILRGEVWRKARLEHLMHEQRPSSLWQVLFTVVPRDN